MSLKLAARLVALESTKIADLQENDTVTHILDLSFILPLGTQAILIHVKRISGASTFNVYPTSGSVFVKMATDYDLLTIPIKNRELKWANAAANDDWDLYLHGYFVQKRTR